MTDLSTSLSKVWSTPEHTEAVYPPPSLHVSTYMNTNFCLYSAHLFVFDAVLLICVMQALLNMYLVDDIPLIRKHSIVMYLLCDLMSVLSHEDDMVGIKT